jgi:hypothetical protein
MPISGAQDATIGFVDVVKLREQVLKNPQESKQYLAWQTGQPIGGSRRCEPQSGAGRYVGAAD